MFSTKGWYMIAIDVTPIVHAGYVCPNANCVAITSVSAT